MALIPIEGPGEEPVTVDDMKAHLRVDYDAEDVLIEQYIGAARQRLEQRCGRTFARQTWELRTADFDDVIEIPNPPTSAILSVKYLDGENVEQTVDDARYDLIDGGDVSASTLIWIGDAPTALYDRSDAARIRFVAGWEPADVPFDIKQAIMFLADHLFNNRAEVMLQPTRQEIAQVPVTVDAFIAPYIIPRL